MWMSAGERCYGMERGGERNQVAGLGGDRAMWRRKLLLLWASGPSAKRCALTDVKDLQMPSPEEWYSTSKLPFTACMMGWAAVCERGRAGLAWLVPVGR